MLVQGSWSCATPREGQLIRSASPASCASPAPSCLLQLSGSPSSEVGSCIGPLLGLPPPPPLPLPSQLEHITSSATSKDIDTSFPPKPPGLLGSPLRKCTAPDASAPLVACASPSAQLAVACAQAEVATADIVSISSGSPSGSPRSVPPESAAPSVTGCADTLGPAPHLAPRFSSVDTSAMLPAFDCLLQSLEDAT